MIIYNVTLKVDKNIAREWQNWMQETHIPEMLSLGIFTKSSFCRLLEQEETEGQTFVTQYFCNNQQDYEEYLEHYAKVMRQKGLDKFGDKAIAFRTLMEVIE